MSLHHKLRKLAKHAWVILAVSILLILIRAIIFPNTIDILIVTGLFVLLLAIIL